MENNFMTWFKGLTGSDFPDAATGNSFREIRSNTWAIGGVSENEIGGLNIWLIRKSGEGPYKLCAFDGHGINSYAVYYTVVEEGIDIRLRLYFGGIYCDEKVAGDRVVKDITAVHAMIERAKAEKVPLKIFANMGQWNINGESTRGPVFPRND
jgi:hypothetical protein